ncbi:hypothetical protein AB0M44_38685 [Streptosporangium subroseum]|uniref:hypothetical protein n=1 Tax=Streptosporangium subroseum TaxID=106412 RepID=UPI00341D0D52
MIAKRTTAALTVCATASSLILAALPVLPAGAAARPIGTTGALAPSGRPAPACTYHVTGVRPGAMLNVRSGAGPAYGSVGTLRAAANGERGWASAHYLRKVTR